MPLILESRRFGGTLALVRSIDTLAVDLPIGWAMDKTKTAFGS